MIQVMTASDPVELGSAHREGVVDYLSYLGCDSSTADDLAQEVLMAALGLAPASEWPEPRLMGYLRGIARNGWVDHLRRQGRAPSMASLDAADRVWARLTPDESADARREALDACVDALGPRARAALALRYGEDTAPRQVAQALGIKFEATKTLLKRTRNQLRDCIKRRLGCER